MHDVIAKDGSVTDDNALRGDDSEYREVNLSRMILSLWTRRYFILRCALAGMLLVYGMSWLITPKYDAEVELMPPTPKQTGLSLLIPTRNAGDQYLGEVNSRTVTDDVIAHQHLADYFHTTRPSALRRALRGMVKIEVDKNQFVTVRVRAKEPDTALRIANEFPAALYRLNDAITLSEAEHQLRYFEAPLEDEKNQLAQAEDALRAAEQQTGMVQPETQVRLGVSAIADLKQQLATREELLAGLETGRTSENPQVVTLQSQIASLETQIARLQAQTGGTAAAANAAKLPALAMEVARRERDVKFHEALFEILSKQYENAKVDEAYSPPVELVDRAVLPDEKSWPPRKLFALGGLLLGALAGALIVELQRIKLRSRIRTFLAGSAGASTVGR
ncbi:MAG TPA: Wzz/FepE/Etk N-terminal domain-containing protein [Acidobacteriaceae bacterium]|jgi:uncharacterized protein involved in exopolysaccharide biosynthesis